MTPQIRSKKVSLRDEIKIIHPAGWVLSGTVLVLWLSFIVPKILAMIAREPNPPPAFVFGLLLVMAGLLMAAATLLAFYVNADAKRRQMNRLLWTLLVIFVPNAIGFIVYFFMRKPIASSCPKCSATVQADFTFCPECGETLASNCPSCRRAIEDGWAACAYCGEKLESGREAA